MTISSQPQKLIIAIPLFNDWEALHLLLLQVDQITLRQNTDLEIVVIDDFSTAPIPKSFISQEYQQINSISILRLRRNLGHQRAISIGLCYVFDNINCDWVVVMDGDGEDNPFEIKILLNLSEQKGNNNIIFAKRTERSESLIFRCFYFVYQQIYRLLTAQKMTVGNFSLLPSHLLKNVVVISEIWNHYSAGIHRSRIPYLQVDIPRKKRLAGKSQMNLVSLVTHGLSSIAVYGDIVGTRILLATVSLLVIFLLLLGIVLTIRLYTTWGFPGSGWATYTSGLLIVSLLQLIILATIFSMTILSARNSFNIIPVRDYKYYVDNFFQLYH
jgi:hypothetical protein